MNIFDEIETMLKEVGHGWTTPNKGRILAASVIALRPKISAEIGCWAGKGLLSLALAHKYIGSGMVYGIDPYSAADSAEGQVNPEDKKWWSDVDHEMIYKLAKENILKYGCQNVCQLIRKKSSEYQPPNEIGLLIIDGNHGEESIGDFERYCPKVMVGGLLFADDLGWSGGAVSKALDVAGFLGFDELYRIENKDENFGVFQKIK
jgi:predicted O-methyltransferase YrrM